MKAGGAQAMKPRNTLLISAVIAALAAVVTPLTALAAATTYTDTVAGPEVFATSTEGVFTGAASGTLPGVWTATVMHSPLSTHATITGGSFDLATTLNNRPVLVVGTFANGGSVDQTGGFSGCVNQTYWVQGVLGKVGLYGQTDSGTGTFQAVLTHYRALIFGSCVTFGASIAGTVTLTF
jgi:hypothetical protein